jgi:hypothetical protein
MSQKIQNKVILILTVQKILCVKVLPVFKAVVVSSGSVFLALLVLSGAIKTAVDGQCLISFDTFFWPNIFYQHCLGLVCYIDRIFHTFTSPEVWPKSPKPQLFKANSAHKNTAGKKRFRKKRPYRGVHASGSCRAILTLYT